MRGGLYSDGGVLPHRLQNIHLNWMCPHKHMLHEDLAQCKHRYIYLQTCVCVWLHMWCGIIQMSERPQWIYRETRNVKHTKPLMWFCLCWMSGILFYFCFTDFPFYLLCTISLLMILMYMHPSSCFGVCASDQSQRFDSDRSTSSHMNEILSHVEAVNLMLRTTSSHQARQHVSLCSQYS